MLAVSQQSANPYASDGSPDISDLLIRARDGDESAKSELVGNYRSHLLRLSQRAVGKKLRRRVDASDIVQQTSTEAWRDVEAFRGTSEREFTAWIGQILRRNVTNMVREQRAAKRDMNRECEPGLDSSASVARIDAPGREATASQRVMKGEMAFHLATIVESLPEGQREAVRMRHLEGLPLAEIAERLNKTTVATAGLIKRGLQALRDVMSESEWR